MSTVQLEKETFQAQRDEKRRLERLEINHQRLKAYVDSHLEETKGRLILEVQQNEVLVEVHPQLVQHMKPHQIKGVRFLFDNVIESVQLMKEGAGQGCILAHSMGLGKTFQTIVFLHTLFTNPLIHQSIKSVLLVVPTNIFMNWGNEIEMWLDFKQLKAFQVYDFRGSRTETQKQAVFESWQKNHGVMLITHSELTSAVFRNRNKSKAYKRALWKAYIQPGPDLVIVDEGHLIKNRKTQLNFVLSRMQTKLRVALTGTPMQNNLFEYYTMCEFVKPHLLGSRKEFEKRFANPIKKGISVDCLPSEHKLMQRRSHVLHKLLQGTVQRVDQSVFAQHLKPKYEYVIKVTMTETQEKMYRQISRRALQESSEKNHLLVYSMLESLCIHPALLCELDSASKTSEYINVADFVDREDALNLDLSNKLKVLVSLIEEAEACGDKIVIFTQRQRMLTILEKYLKQMERQRSCFSGKFRFSTWKLNEDYFRLDGHIGTEQRDASLQVFNNRSIARARLLMATTRACGIGVNMFGANRGVLFDVSWNPSVDIQAIFRLYRFGQEKPVYIYRLCTYAAFEEHIFRRQILKESMTQRVIDEKEFNRILAKEDFETMVSYEPDFSDRPALDTPVDKLLASVMVKHSDLIYEVLNHDWLLEDRSDEQLTEEERNSAWMEFETQQKNSESGLIAENYPPLFDIHCPTTSRQDASSTISNTFNTYEVNSPVNGCDPNFSSSESLVSNVPTQSTSGLNNVNDPFTHIKMKWQTQSDRNQQARSVSTQNISKSNAWTKQFTSTAQRAQPKTAKKKVNSNGNPACSNNHPSGPKPKSPLTFVSKETFEQLISTRPTSKELPKFLMTPIDPGISEKICRCIVATGFNCNFQDHVRNLHRQGLLDQFDHFTMFRAILTDLVETKTQLFSDNLNKVLNAIRQNGYTPNSIPDAVLNFIIRGKSDLNSLCNIYRVLEVWISFIY